MLQNAEAVTTVELKIAKVLELSYLNRMPA